MLAIPATTWRYHRTMSANAFRLAIIVAVVAVSILGIGAFGVVLRSETPDRGVLLAAILGFLGPTVVSLLNLLKTDAVAAQQEAVHKKVEAVQEFVENGGLRESVKRAISEDRHAKAQRDTAAQLREQIDERRRRAAEPPDGPA
jgi:hypothetical protein